MKRASNPKRQFAQTQIRAWRQHRGLSQDRLVERMRERLTNFSKSTLSRIENGKQPYTQPVLEAIADALQCTPADLIMRDPQSPLWSLMDILQSLPSPQQSTVFAMIDGLKKAS